MRSPAPMRFSTPLLLTLLSVTAIVAARVEAQPGAVFSETVIDVGAVNKGDRASYEFTVQNEGEQVLQITEVKPTRSLEQNSYLFGVVYKTILDHNLREQGWTAEDVHEFYCGEHFGWKPLDGLGRTRLKPIRTTTTDIYGKRSVLTKMEFSDFIAYIQQKSAENGIFIPDPEEQ